MYSLYSGLDGTYNIHGVYIHPVICFMLSIFFRILPSINWHTIFLLISQFICFTLIGYTIIKKHDNIFSIILYSIFASVFYATLLMLIQYTSVSALLILTSLFLLIDIIEQKEEKTLKYKIVIFALFAVGIMIRTQSLIIILPFMAIYFIKKLYEFSKKQISKTEILKITKYYIIYVIITAVIYISSIIIYNSNSVYKEYMEYNDVRATLQDILYVNYKENKEIFDEIGWSENDYYMFYTFNYGDENIYSKENLEKILNYKIQKDGRYSFRKDLLGILNNLFNEWQGLYVCIAIAFILVFAISIFGEEQNLKFNILIFFTTIFMHLLFIAIGRDMQRVVIPGYIIRNSNANI